MDCDTAPCILEQVDDVYHAVGEAMHTPEADILKADLDLLSQTVEA